MGQQVEPATVQAMRHAQPPRQETATTDLAKRPLMISSAFLIINELISFT